MAKPSVGAQIALFFVVELTLAALGIWLIPRLLGLVFLSAGSRLVDRAILAAGLPVPSSFACEVGPVRDTSALHSLNRAKGLLQTALFYNAEDAQTHLVLGRTTCLLGQPESAMDNLLEYTRLRPDNPLGYVELGLAIEAYCGDEVERIIQLAVERNSSRSLSLTTQKCNPEMVNFMLASWKRAGTPQDFLTAGDQLRRTHKFTEAGKWYRRAAWLEPGWGTAWYNVGLMEEQQGNFASAIAAYENAILVSGADHDIRPYYALALLFQNKLADYERALEIYRSVAALDPLPVDAYLNMGVIFEKLNHEKEALTAYQAAVQVSYYANGDSSEDHRKRVWPLYVLADYHLRLGQLEIAADVYKQALDRDPKQIYAGWSLWGLGRIALQQKRYQEAEQLLQQALPLANNNYLRSQVYFKLGELSLQQGKQLEGLEYLKKAHLEHSENQGLHKILADALRNAGYLNEAIDEYEKYLSRWPNDATVQQALEEARQALVK